MDDSVYIWISPVVALIAAQILKPILIMLRLRRWDGHLVRQSGGMPSSHTAAVTALVVELGLREGGANPVLAIAIFIALIVMYDAAGVRWQTGRQAAVLNKLLHDLRGQNTVSSAKILEEKEKIVQEIGPLSVARSPWWLIDWPVLDEHVGHKPTEVLGGLVVGVIVAFALN